MAFEACAYDALNFYFLFSSFFPDGGVKIGGEAYKSAIRLALAGVSREAYETAA